MKDSLLMLRAAAAGALSADELTPTAIDFGGPDVQKMTYNLKVPIAPTGTTPTLLAVIQGSHDNSTFYNWMTFKGRASDGLIDARNEYRVTGKCPFRYRRYTADLTGAGANFGVVTIAAEVAGQYDKF